MEVFVLIPQERLEELEYYFWKETNDETTQEWRNNLNQEEEKLIGEWEKEYYGAYAKLCSELAKNIRTSEDL